MAALLASLAIVLGLGGRALGGSLEPVEERTRPQVLMEEGTTLWAIARARVGPEGDPRPYIQEILELNGLASSELGVGQRLALPAVD